jgi:hypothetical protein
MPLPAMATRARDGVPHALRSSPSRRHTELFVASSWRGYIVYISGKMERRARIHSALTS